MGFEFVPPEALIQSEASMVHFRCPNCEHRFDFQLEKSSDHTVSNISLPDLLPPGPAASASSSTSEEEEGNILIRTHDRQRLLALNWEEVGALISEGFLQPEDKVSAFGKRWKKANKIPQLDTYFAAKLNQSEPAVVAPEPIAPAQPEPVIEDFPEPVSEAPEIAELPDVEIPEIQERSNELDNSISPTFVPEPKDQKQLLDNFPQTEMASQLAEELKADPSVPFDSEPIETPDFVFPSIDFSGEASASVDPEEPAVDSEPDQFGEPMATDEVLPSERWEKAEAEAPTQVGEHIQYKPEADEEIESESSPEAMVAVEEEFPQAIEALEVSQELEESPSMVRPTTFVDDLDGPDFPIEDSDEFVDFEAYQNKMTRRIRIFGAAAVAAAIALFIYTFTGFEDGPEIAMTGEGTQSLTDEVNPNFKPPDTLLDPAKEAQPDAEDALAENSPNTETDSLNTENIDQGSSGNSAVEGDAVTGLSDTNGVSEKPPSGEPVDSEMSENSEGPSPFEIPEDAVAQTEPSGEAQAEPTEGVAEGQFEPSEADSESAVDNSDQNIEQNDVNQASVGAEALVDAGSVQEDAVVFDPSSVDRVRLTREGFLRIQQRRYDEAEAIFAYAIEQDPEDPYVLHGLGWAYEEQGEPLAAATQYCRLVGLEEAPEDLKRECQARVKQLEQSCINGQP